MVMMMMLWLQLRGCWFGGSRSDGIRSLRACGGGGGCGRLHLPFRLLAARRWLLRRSPFDTQGMRGGCEGPHLRLTLPLADRRRCPPRRSLFHAQGVRGRLRETSLIVCYASAALVASALAAGLLLCETPRIGIKAWATRKKNPDAARPAGVAKPH